MLRIPQFVQRVLGIRSVAKNKTDELKVLLEREEPPRQVVNEIISKADPDKQSFLLEAVKYYKEKGWRIDDLTTEFSKLVTSKPTEEQWKVYIEAVKHCKEKSWGINDLTTEFSKLVTSNATKEQLEVYVEAVKYYKEKGWRIDDLTAGFAKLVKSGFDQNAISCFSNLYNFFKEQERDLQGSINVMLRLNKLNRDEREIAYTIINGIAHGEKINLPSEKVRSIIKKLVVEETEESSTSIQYFQNAGIIDLELDIEGGLNVVLRSDDREVPKGDALDAEVNERLERLYDTGFSEN